MEEYPPLEEWSTGWAENWALSSSSTGLEIGSCSRDTATNTDTEGQGWFGNGKEAAADEQFLRMMIRLKHPSSELQARWNEFVELSTAEKVNRIRELVLEIRRHSS